MFGKRNTVEKIEFFKKKLCNSSLSLDFERDLFNHEYFGEVPNQAELRQKCTQMLNKQPEWL